MFSLECMACLCAYIWFHFSNLASYYIYIVYILIFLNKTMDHEHFIFSYNTIIGDSIIFQIMHVSNVFHQSSIVGQFALFNF